MKKVLLIIAVTFLIFQTVVLAVAIDIGVAAINRTSAGATGYTYVNKGNPADFSGTITQIQIYADTELLNFEVGIFEEVSTNTLTTRSNVTLGTIPAGYSEHNVNLVVVAGDYLGSYFTDGDIDVTTSSGDGYWYKNTDYIPITDGAFSFIDGRCFSLYGTGITAEEEEENVIFFGTNF